MVDDTVAAERRDFYVYVLFRPNGVPCYVGKGRRDRWEQHEQAANGGYHPNAHLARIIRNSGGSIPRIKVREDLTHFQALETEAALISAIGRSRNGGPLANMNDGGEGQIGWVPSVETRARISAAHKGRKASEKTKAIMRHNRKGKPKSAAHAQAVGNALRGKPKTPEHVEKLRLIGLGLAEKSRERAAKHHAEMTVEQKIERSRKISEATRKRMADPDVREKFDAAIKRRDNSQMHLHFKGRKNG